MTLNSRENKWKGKKFPYFNRTETATVYLDRINCTCTVRWDIPPFYYIASPWSGQTVLYYSLCSIVCLFIIPSGWVPCNTICTLVYICKIKVINNWWCLVARQRRNNGGTCSIAQLCVTERTPSNHSLLVKLSSNQAMLNDIALNIAPICIAVTPTYELFHKHIPCRSECVRWPC